MTAEDPESAALGRRAFQVVVFATGFWGGCVGVKDGGVPSPLGPTLDSSHLKLWLRADVGIVCDAGRVTRWIDQSPRRSDATLQQRQLGPQCQVTPTPHVINGVDVPYFSAPVSSTAPNVVDGTLDVDLSFLAGSSYAIFAVERRWADPPTNAEYFLGTSLPSGLEAHQTCAVNGNTALSLGYINYQGAFWVSIDHGCNGLNASVMAVPATAPAPPALTTAMFGKSSGRELWIDGAPVAQDLNQMALVRATGGAIGRSIDRTTVSGQDLRYRGDIAEIAIYDTTLSDADRVAIEKGLSARWALRP